jgi:hypothetical protein
MASAKAPNCFASTYFFVLFSFSFSRTYLLLKLARGGNDIRQGAIFVSHKWRLGPIQQLPVLSLKRRLFADPEVRTSVKGETWKLTNQGAKET